MNITATRLGKTFFKPYNEFTSDSEQLLSHLNIEVVSANHFECSKEWNLEPRRVNDSYWTWIISGCGKLYLGNNNTEYMVKKGDFILFPQYYLHSLKPESDTTMSMINVHFHARIYGILDMVSHYNLAGVYKDKDNQLFEFNSCEAAREYCLKPKSWQRSLAARIELVLLNLIRSRKFLPTKNREISKLLALQVVLELVESDLDDPNLSVTDMAAIMDLSEVYLRTLFRRQLGISPIKYLRRQRINRACTLLRKTIMPIRLIAVECGFREVQFFHRVFRDITGITPHNYRKNPIF